MHPQWRQDVYDLARQMTSSDMVHLDRDLAEKQCQYEQLQHRGQSAAHRDEALHRDPAPG
jgi:hypothetical protein